MSHMGEALMWSIRMPRADEPVRTDEAIGMGAFSDHPTRASGVHASRKCWFSDVRFRTLHITAIPSGRSQRGICIIRMFSLVHTLLVHRAVSSCVSDVSQCSAHSSRTFTFVCCTRFTAKKTHGSVSGVAKNTSTWNLANTRTVTIETCPKMHTDLQQHHITNCITHHPDCTLFFRLATKPLAPNLI